jgi:uncharacterized membrane protein
MRIFTTGLMLTVLVSGSSGCGGDSAQQAEDPASRGLIRGVYTFGHEVRELRPCAGEEEIWVVDKTGILAEQHARLNENNRAYYQIFILALGSTGPAPAAGFGRDYPGQATIDELIYAAAEGFGCDFDPSRLVYRAQGNEPFWLVEVLPDRMRLERPGFAEMSWPEVTADESGEELRLRGSGDQGPAVLTITPGPAYDSMSGAYFHRSARFELEGTVYRGQALRGGAVLGGR